MVLASYVTGIIFIGYQPDVEVMHVSVLLYQPYHVLEAIPAIVAGITGEHGRPALSLDVK